MQRERSCLLLLHNLTSASRHALPDQVGWSHLLWIPTALIIVYFVYMLSSTSTRSGLVQKPYLTCFHIPLFSPGPAT